MSRLLPLLLSLLCACETNVTPPPEVFHILDITPPRQVRNEEKTVTVRLDVEPRFHVDYGDKQVRMLEEPVLELRSQTESLVRTVPLNKYLGHGRFQGRIPAGLSIGLYDIRVMMGEGREASRSSAYEVRPPVDFWVDNIGDQYAREPFTITLHAGGPDADSFEGTVQVSLYKDNATTFSFRSDPFTAGVLQQEISIDTPGSNYLIILPDDQDILATSNAFTVLSRD